MEGEEREHLWNTHCRPGTGLRVLLHSILTAQQEKYRYPHVVDGKAAGAPTGREGQTMNKMSSS